MRQKSVQRQRTGTAKDKGNERGAIPLRLIVGFGFMGARLREDCARTGEVSIDPACAGRACFRPVGLGGNSRRVVRRLAVLLGAFIPLASIPMAILLLVAIFTVHLPHRLRASNLLS